LEANNSLIFNLAAHPALYALYNLVKIIFAGIMNFSLILKNIKIRGRGTKNCGGEKRSAERGGQFNLVELIRKS